MKKKNRRRVERQAATLAETMNEGERQAARKLVGCPKCNMNFFRDVCTKKEVPFHYRVKPGAKSVTVEACPGGHMKYRHQHPRPTEVFV